MNYTPIIPSFGRFWVTPKTPLLYYLKLFCKIEMDNYLENSD